MFYRNFMLQHYDSIVNCMLHTTIDKVYDGMLYFAYKSTASICVQYVLLTWLFKLVQIRLRYLALVLLNC